LSSIRLNYLAKPDPGVASRDDRAVWWGVLPGGRSVKGAGEHRDEQPLELLL
jgi:hypothetical protein